MSKKEKTNDGCKLVDKNGELCGKTIKKNGMCAIHYSRFPNINEEDLQFFKICPKSDHRAIWKDDHKYCYDHRGIPCKAINQKGQPCSWNALEGSNYCKRHQKYEEMEEGDMKMCTGHKQMCPISDFIENGIEYGTCSKCRHRDKTKYKQDIKVCSGVTQHGQQCNYKCVDGEDYCEKHLLKYKNFLKAFDSSIVVVSKIDRKQNHLNH